MVRRAVCRDTGLAGQPWLAMPLGVAITIDASPTATVSSAVFMLCLTLSENRLTRNALPTTGTLAPGQCRVASVQSSLRGDGG